MFLRDITPLIPVFFIYIYVTSKSVKCKTKKTNKPTKKKPEENIEFI